MSDKQGVPTLPPLTGGGNNNGGSSSSSGTQQQTVNLQQVLASQGLNVLTTGAGQQFVIASSVPGLSQVIQSGATTTAGLQQVTRIVNISNMSSGSPLGSPNRQNTTKVVLATSPKLVRTSLGNMFLTPTSQITSSPPAKKLKLSETSEKPTLLDDTNGYRRRIMEHRIKRMRAIREKYAENVSELYFLHAGGNIMDFQAWKKKQPTASYLQFLRQHRLDPDDENEDLTIPLPVFTNIAVSTVTTLSTSNATSSQGVEVKLAGVGVTPVAVSTTLPATVAQLSQQVPDSSKPAVMTTNLSANMTNKQPAASTSIKTISPATTVAITTVANTVTSTSPPTSSGQPVVKLVKMPANSPSSCDSQNNEQIAEKAKQEAYVMQRINELQREGLWSEKRLPKVQEPPRTKAHWDYLLEEMVWLSTDFAQERKWKKAAAKKCARMVQKHFLEKEAQAQKAEKMQEHKLKKMAGVIAKEVKTFWANVEKLVEFKQQTRLDEKRKKVLDQRLNFMVGQTEKFSTWLTEGLNKTEGTMSISASKNSSRISSPLPTQKQHSDDEFEPNQSSEDDEETIAKAEEEIKSNHKEEVELLKKESEIPLEDLLKELPPNYLEERDKSLSPSPEDSINVQEEEENNTDGDAEFTVASEESSDDENTIMEQEEAEGNSVDHRQELDDLKAENEMSIDELMAKYGNMSGAMEVDEDSEHESGKESDKDDDKEDDEEEPEAEAEAEAGVEAEAEDKSESENESEDETKEDDEDSQSQSDDETDVGLKSLLEDLDDKSSNKNPNESQSEAHNEMDDAAALAESIQPKGNTLLTTSVVTKIPFLLKHSLREYQHIGLDWLVTMYERKLNGILADEMGLGKTIQTIALLAHLACEKGNWGPHLIIVPTSVMLNWEMECKKWCPGFKILTYYGTQKERKQKRTGWTKPNAFHICITSYKLVIQDHQSFRRKKWKYLILDEAQNIKNFKSQRWQLLLNFQTQRRLLLTGTPLQNNLMELWSLMHFLMPNVFQSHREFKEWFSNPVTGMIEGNSEYNENIIRRLHKVLRPFLLRRLKTEVEKQLPKKYEHVIMCRLSKRQRFLYDDFMSRAKTRETLASGNLLSVINVLMQLRKVCNHPNLFEVRPTVSPFQMEAIDFVTASLVWNVLDYDFFKHIDLSILNLNLLKLERTITAFVSHRVRRFQTPRKLIEEIDSQPPPPPRCPAGKIKITVRLSNQVKPPPVTPQQITQAKIKSLTGILPTPRVGTSPLIKTLNNQTTGQGVTLRVAGGQQLQGYVQLVQHQGNVKAIPMAAIPHNSQTTSSSTGTPTTINAQKIAVSSPNIRDGLQRLTQTVTFKQGDSVQRIPMSSFAQLVQTSTGRHIILHSSQQTTNTVSFPVMTSSGQRLTVLSPKFTPVTKVVGGVVTTSANTVGGRPVMRVPPLNVSTTVASAMASPPQPQIRSIVTRGASIVTTGGVTSANNSSNANGTAQQKEVVKKRKESPKSDFYMAQLEEDRRQRRQAKLRTIANINERKCAACPLYGEDLFTALRIDKPASGCQWHNGWLNCTNVKQPARTRRQYFSRTEALAQAIKSTEQIVEELKEVFERFVCYVPAVRAPVPRFHVSHPAPSKLWQHQRMQMVLQRRLTPRCAVLHPISSAMMTQFPDPRLIQYDCGKLQSLDRLLRKLKSGSHRVLIFTQMTRMLDVLEAFLNYHGHIYLRLDGTTRVDQRQFLMERFNGDKRIFCFILSTRSGGVGVNLTGADTVIFYDSDWNPTMDAQAQDRCHRIGQTRDVHIYRLVSEKTVEENILKKANQKRLLGDLAIEGGNFTTAYFKSSTIQDLFNIDQTENDASARMADIVEQKRERDKSLLKEVSSYSSSNSANNSNAVTPVVEEKVAMGALESALAAAEEDLDVLAAKTAKAEAVADLAEFDENIPLDDADREDTQISKAEQEVQNLISQLTPVERYAMKFVEETEGTFSAAQLAAAERELEEQKKEWELDRLRALREEEERRMRMADDDDKPLTFSREDAQNQVNSNNNSKRLGNNSNKKSQVAPSRRSSRRCSRTRESSASDSESSTESESESQEDLAEDLAEDNNSDVEESSQDSQVDDDDEMGEEGDNDDDVDGDNEDDDSQVNKFENTKRGPGRPKKIKLRKNHLDLNSPRTRSRGNVKINLWTLDVSPILPVVKRSYKEIHWRKRNKRDNNLEKSTDNENNDDNNSVVDHDNDANNTDDKSSVVDDQSKSVVLFTSPSVNDAENEINQDEKSELGSVEEIIKSDVDEKMSDVTGSMIMDMSESNDESDNKQEELTSELSNKTTPRESSCSESPKLTSDTLEEHKVPCDESKRTRSSRNNAKKLSDDSIAKFEISEEVNHVTRSHKPEFKDIHEDTENLDVNVGSPNNKINMSPITVNDVVDDEYCIISNKEKSGDDSSADSSCTDVNAEPKIETIILRKTRTRSSLSNVPLSNRTRRASKIHKPEEIIDFEAKEIKQESIDGVEEEKSQLEKTSWPKVCVENILLDESVPIEATILPPVEPTVLKSQNSDDKTSESSPNPNLTLRLKITRPDTPFPRILRRRAKAHSPFAEPLAPVSDESRKARKSLEKKIVKKSPDSESVPEEEKKPEGRKSPILILSDIKLKLPIPKSLQLQSQPQPQLQPESSTSSSSRVTRSSMILDSPIVVIKERSSSDRPTTRSQGNMDNGFLLPTQINRKSRGNSQPKVIATTSESKSKLNDSVNTLLVTPKRRPDTPVPKKSSRITRSADSILFTNYNLNTNLSNKNNKTRRTSTCPEKSEDAHTHTPSPENISTKKDSLDTDSNGNAVNNDSFTHKDKDAATPVDNERPQRTAKVVAMITLDTHSRINHNKMSPHNISSKKSEEKRDCEVVCMEDPVGIKVRSRSNKLISSASPSSSSPVETVALNDESESDSDTELRDKRLRSKSIKRSQRLIKSGLKNKFNDIQISDAADNDDELGPNKKIIKLSSVDTKLNRQVS